MKLLKFLGIIVLASTVFSCNNKKTFTKESLKTEIDSVSYALGMDVANSIGSNFKDVNNELFVEGYNSTMDSATTVMDISVAQTIVQLYAQKIRREMMEEQETLAKAEGEEFLEANKTNEGVKTTDSGLQYLVLKEGTGAKPKDEDVVSIYYTGTLIDGTTFDSNVEGEPLNTLRVNQFVPGFSEGLKLMPVGSKYKFFIPQELGYGANSQPGSPIKPYSALVFEVELLDIVK